MNFDEITFCITLGSRPKQLLNTLKSLKKLLPQIKVIGINDFGDQESSDIFRKMVPHGILLEPSKNLGQVLAVDEMYKLVNTEYILHCEDDWKFNRDDFLSESIEILNQNPNLISICFRDIYDHMYGLTKNNINAIFDLDTHYLLEKCDPVWFGFTFNPHLIRANVWRELGGYSKFESEINLSKYFRKIGKQVGFLKVGACKHIGWDLSVSNLYGNNRFWLNRQRLKRMIFSLHKKFIN